MSSQFPKMPKGLTILLHVLGGCIGLLIIAVTIHLLTKLYLETIG